MYWSSWNRSSSSRPFSEDAGRDVGMADRAQEDGVERAQLVDGARGQDFAGAQVAVAAEVEVRQLVA